MLCKVHPRAETLFLVFNFAWHSMVSAYFFFIEQARNTPIPHTYMYTRTFISCQHLLIPAMDFRLLLFPFAAGSSMKTSKVRPLYGATKWAIFSYLQRFHQCVVFLRRKSIQSMRHLWAQALTNDWGNPISTPIWFSVWTYSNERLRPPENLLI